MKKLKFESKSRKYSTFEILNMLISILVIAFIASTILAIILKGIPSIGEAIRSDEVRFAIRLSLFTASISTLLCIFLAIPTAYTLVRTSMPFKRFAQIILELPLSMPYLVLGLGLLIIFSTDAGKALRDMGFKVVFDKNGIIIAQTVVNLPYAIRLIKIAFLEIDERLEYIAGILGATKWKRFLSIVLPLSKNAMISAFILVWSRGLGEFGATLMLVGATRMKTETLPTSIYLNMATGDLSAAMASAMIILLISFISLFITSRLETNKAAVSRMKDVM
jgi:molybdate transport system permease protein